MATRTVIQKERTTRDIPPIIAGVVSAILPGSGHSLIGYWELGLYLLISSITVLGLLFWRISVIAYRQTTWSERIQVAFRRQPMLYFLVILWLTLTITAVLDAYKLALHKKRNAGLETLSHIVIIIMFFMLGWQIVEIKPVKLITEFADTFPIITKIAWPWPSAFIKDEAIFQGEYIIYSDCEGKELPDPSDDPASIPYITASPRCGILSGYDLTGTMLSVQGNGFRPNEEVVMWWEDPIGKAFRVRYQGDFVKAVTNDRGEFEIEFAMPNLLIPPTAGEGPHAHKLQARQTSLVGNYKPSQELMLAIEKMVETIFLGMMATLFGIIFAIPVSFLAARNLMSGSPLTLLIYNITRFFLNIVRSIEPIIWAIVATLWVGLGPFAGVIALMFHSIAALGKLYSEAIESIDAGPIEAVHATGANWIQTIVYAVIPQVIPPFVSFTIYRWDINVRMSTIIGAVGGGGIGFLLIQWIRLTDYRSAGIAVWFIAITVAILDLVSSKIRERYV
ncbi:MAG: phosphonate ABC transporter, permease protein PhnE [Anaerolineae bacterium]|nr:phosphonate ABC transporter, permease protein PhnE [Anaerolineae bacterium]